MFDPRITDPYAHYWVHQAYTALNYRGGLATYCALCGRTSTVPIENTIASHGRIPPRTPPPTGGDKREEGEWSPARLGALPERRRPPFPPQTNAGAHHFHRARSDGVQLLC